MGGAVGTPLLFTSFLLATALVYTIKKNGKASKKNDGLATTANTQMDGSLLVTGTSYDDVVSSGSVESSSPPHIHVYDNESMYTNAAYGT